jgi:hypothetical protein
LLNGRVLTDLELVAETVAVLKPKIPKSKPKIPKSIVVELLISVVAVIVRISSTFRRTLAPRTYVESSIFPMSTLEDLSSGNTLTVF